MNRIHAISGAGPPERHLGADVHQVNEDKLKEMGLMGSKIHVNEAVDKVERTLGETMKLGKTPVSMGIQPEMDGSPFASEEDES